MFNIHEDFKNTKSYFSERLSNHAKLRLSQRGISLDDLVITILFGDEFYQNTGSVAYYFSTKSYKNKHLSSLKEKIIESGGTAVILSEDNYIITAFKNKNLKNITKRFKKS